MTDLEVAALIRKRRTELGLRQLDLAIKVGVSRYTVIRWESGKSRPQNHHLLVLARLLGVDPENFL